MLKNLHNRFLGGTSPYLMSADDGAAAGGGGGADPGAAAAAAAAAAGGADKGADKGGSSPADKTLAGGADPGAAAAAAATAAAAAGASGGLPQGFDFRAYLAAGDKDAEKDLAKYTDPRAVYKSLRDLQGQISSGKLKAPPAPLPENATDAQKTEWRAANGLPATPEAYIEKLELPNGIVVGEADKPLVAEFAKDLHAAGATQAEMNRAMASYYRLQGVAEAHRGETDKQLQIETDVALRTEWGPEYKPNMNAFGTLKAMMPAEVQTAIFAARTHDGRMLGNTPELLKWGAELARQINPTATLISPSAPDAAKAVADEIASIEATYAKALSGDREAHRQYYGHDGKPGLDVRQRELIAADQAMKARGKAA